MPSSALDDLGFGDPGDATPKTSRRTEGGDISGGYHISKPPPPLPDESDQALLARAAIAEAGSNPDGQRAVMGALLQRQALSGKPIAELLKEPGAIQTYWNGKIQSIDPASPAFQSALQIAQTAQPTPGRDSWFSPKGIAAQGFGKPPFDPASGVMVGGQLFGSGYKPGVGSAKAASALDDLGFGEAGAGGEASAVPAAADSLAPGRPKSAAAVPVLDRVAADIARAKMAQTAHSDTPHWPIYDEANDVWRERDGSIVQLGGRPVPETRGPNGDIEVTVNSGAGAFSPKAINDWMAAHPLDPSNSPSRAGAGPQSSALGRAGVGSEQGLQNVLHSVEGADLALRSNPLASVFLPNQPGMADWERADQARGLLQRNANDMALGQSGAYQGGKFGGEVVGTLPAMLATDGAAGAGLGALREAGVIGDAAPGANWLMRAPMSLAQSAGRGAIYGGEAGALTSAGSNAPLQDQIAAGAEQGAVLNPLLGGVGASGKALGKFVSPFVEPLTAAGREGILDRNMVGATGPLTADLNEYVPGSRPTLAQATQNPTLAVTERTLRSNNSGAANAFGALQDANAGAREDFVNDIRADAPTVERLKAARDAQTTTLRAAAFANKTPTDPMAVVQGIDDMLDSPAGKRDAVVKALKNVRSKLVSEVDTGNGKVLQLETDPEQLYGVRQSIDDLLSPLSEDKDARLAKAQLMQVKNGLDAVIEQGAPGFGRYLSAYSTASKPIEALEYLQSLNLHDMRGNITLGKVNQAVTRLESDRAEPGVNPAKSLTDDQVQALYRLRADLRRADLTTPLGKAARSGIVTGNLDNEGAVNTLLSPVAAGVLGTVGHHPVGAGAIMLGRLARESQKAKIGNLLIDRLLNPDVTKAPLNVPAAAAKGNGIGWRAPLLAGAGVSARNHPVRPNPLIAPSAPLQ